MVNSFTPRRFRSFFKEVSKEILISVGCSTSFLLGGGLIFGFSPLAKALVDLPGSPFKNAGQGLTTVSSVFTIGHNITAWGCILSGVVLEKFGPRFCAVSGLLIEALGHFGMWNAAHTSPIMTVVAYGLIGLGGCQVLLAALTFADAFKKSALAASVLTIAFQAGGFVFMVLPLIPGHWELFFQVYTVTCVGAAVVLAVIYPDEPLPAYSEHVEGESGPAALYAATTRQPSLRSILKRPGTIAFLVTFMVAGSALTYGMGVFPVVINSIAGCTWDEDHYDTPCKYETLSDSLQNVWLPFVGNFILPASLTLGWLIDHGGFAFPAFINILFVQVFILLLWILPIDFQFLTLLACNVANTAVFTVQNAYICSVGHNHIGSLFAISNLVLGLGNLVADVLAADPFGSGKDAVPTSLGISCVFWLIVCCPLFIWVAIERTRWSKTKQGINISFSRSFVSNSSRSFASEAAGVAIAVRSFLSGQDNSLNSTGLLSRDNADGRELDKRLIGPDPTVTVNPTIFAARVADFKKAGAHKMFFVFDFNQTITKCFLKDGSTSFDGNDILASIPKIAGVTGMESLLEKYYPIEIDPEKTHDQKEQGLREWGEEINKLLEDQQLTSNDFKEAVKSCTKLDLRDRVGEVFQFAFQNQIPIIIISTGPLGNIIEEVIEQRILSRSRDMPSTCAECGIRVLSNTLKWENDGRRPKFSKPLIHKFNASLKYALQDPDFQDIQDILQDRDFGLLCGDDLADLNMANSDSDLSRHKLLTFGFLNENPKQRSSMFGREGYDRVIFNDGSFGPVLEVLEELGLGSP